MGKAKGRTTVGFLVIGDEILSGTVRDENTPWLIDRLRRAEVTLGAVHVVPDDVGAIARSARLLASAFDLLVTSGGIGPTHDDVTFQGIARAMGVPLERHQQFEALIRGWYGDDTTEHALSMADLPRGARLVFTPDDAVPTVAVSNVFVLPGVPRYFQRRFTAVVPELRGATMHRRRLFIAADEARLALLLETVQREIPGAKLGSYPAVTSGADYRVMVAVESLAEDEAERAVQRLAGELGDLALRIERD